MHHLENTAQASLEGLPAELRRQILDKTFDSGIRRSLVDPNLFPKSLDILQIP